MQPLHRNSISGCIYLPGIYNIRREYCNNRQESSHLCLWFRWLTAVCAGLGRLGGIRRVYNCITPILLKAAYTSIAASLIDGKTTHTIAGISLNSMGDDSKLSDEAKAKPQQFWQQYSYLIIDEYSMLAKRVLAHLSRNVGIGKPSFSANPSFGGLNVITCGDFHQFPPIAQPLHKALYHPINPEWDSVESQATAWTYHL